MSICFCGHRSDEHNELGACRARPRGVPSCTCRAFVGRHSLLPDMVPNPGYHLKEIPKGVLGDLSKVFEELHEASDAEEQGAKVMVLVELSDVLGALDAYLKNHHPGVGLEDLIKMSEITQRAFKSGRRT